MQKYHRKIIQTHFQELVEDLEPNPVMRYLYEKGIISEEDLKAIRSKDTREEMNEALLLQLRSKGPHASKRLFEGLQKYQPYLADFLLEEGKSPPRRISKSRKICNVYTYIFTLNRFHKCAYLTSPCSWTSLWSRVKKVILAGKLAKFPCYTCIRQETDDSLL